MNVTAPEDCTVPSLNLAVKRGETVEVPDKIGASLVTQGWAKATDTKKPDPTPKKES
jgi:hypothetical protein